MLNKIAAIVFYILIPVSIFVLLGFATGSNSSLPCSSFKVIISKHGESNFLDSAAVVKQVYDVMDSLPGQKIQDLSLSRIENLINEMHYVKSSQVYRTIDGAIVAKVKQREPVARIINAQNESYYIDNTGLMMKTSQRYSARVLVVTGHITSRYSPVVNLSENGLLEEESKSLKILKELFLLVEYINKDKFLKAWIDQIFVTRSGSFELIPKNGSHVVEFGDIQDMDEKFKKLILFYKDGLTHVGWNNYQRINLKFKNQIVCSK